MTMEYKTKWVVSTLCTITILMGIFLVGTQSYFNSKEIDNASNQCYDIGGTPEVESSFLAISYSFECHTE